MARCWNFKIGFCHLSWVVCPRWIPKYLALPEIWLCRMYGAWVWSCWRICSSSYSYSGTSSHFFGLSLSRVARSNVRKGPSSIWRVAMSCGVVSPMSSAKARVVMVGGSVDCSSRRNGSMPMANTDPLVGHPCFIPLVIMKPSCSCRLYCSWHVVLWYSCCSECSSGGGSCMCRSKLKR